MSTSTNTKGRPAAARRSPAMAWAAACTALLMGLTSIGAQAQPRDQRHGHDRRDRNHPSQRHMQPRPQGPAQMRPHRGPPPHAQARGRGAGPDHRWHRGDRVPPMYRSNHYVVNNWRAHHLSAPPRGYHWVQYGSDYLLVAVATGVIAQLILSQ